MTYQEYIAGLLAHGTPLEDAIDLLTSLMGY